MADKKLTSINPLIADGDHYQTAVNCRRVVRYVAMANPQAESEELDFGRYLILETVVGALTTVEQALHPARRRSLEVVSG